MSGLGTGPQPAGPRPALPVADHAARRDRARERLAEHGLGALVVTASANVRWLTGFSGTNGQVLLATDPGDDRLVTDHRYEERAAAEAPDIAVALTRDPVSVALASGQEPVGVEAGHLSWADARRWKQRAIDQDRTMVATEGFVEALRVTKDDAELARLAAACAITVDALEWLFAEMVTPGRTERELARTLERRFVDLGADAVAFPSIVASGPNAAIPHHAPTDRALRAGDLLTVDCGALVEGYHADCTRTVAIGHLDADLLRVYAAVEEAQARGRAAAVAGATGGEVDAACRNHLADAGLGEAFVHGTGHGVGLDIHEAPAVAKGATATLEVATALTVEPGAYLPGLGGVRIEDTLVVTSDGPPTVLTPAPRELRIL